MQGSRRPCAAGTPRCHAWMRLPCCGHGTAGPGRQAARPWERRVKLAPFKKSEIACRTGAASFVLGAWIGKSWDPSVNSKG